MAAWHRLITQYTADTIETAAQNALGYPATWATTPGEIDRIGRAIKIKPQRVAGD